jgi:hypothetical protein
MTAGDAPRFTAGLMALAELCETPMPETKLALYFKALADLSIEQVEAAVEILARTSCHYGMPKPVHIREAALGSPQDVAVLAWERVLTALRHHGGYVSVDFQDPIIHRVVEDLGGWVKLCDLPSDPKEQAYRMQDFMKLYRVYQVKLPGRAPDHLPGRCEIDNRTSFGNWTRGLAHVDQVLVLDHDGRGVVTRRSLTAGRTELAIRDGTA